MDYIYIFHTNNNYWVGIIITLSLVKYNPSKIDYIIDN